MLWRVVFCILLALSVLLAHSYGFSLSPTSIVLDNETREVPIYATHPVWLMETCAGIRYENQLFHINTAQLESNYCELIFSRKDGPQSVIVQLQVPFHNVTQYNISNQNSFLTQAKERLRQPYVQEVQVTQTEQILQDPLPLSGFKTLFKPELLLVLAGILLVTYIARTKRI